ncbi:phosphoglycerate mutase-like protein [Parathielavia appendiculata]|uniref:Phosphoglycerate mutase-like protein n=1 Tax=Parathielavia appendiculata TaxID=2587402 RepID=A0AAN6Z832_9PEZI|nr:phosphoglycerate mutase-like protein [Parathielavia appendiculata]
MPTYIHLVRHAQGWHNLSKENEAIPDPELTALGKEQCAKLAKTFPHHAQVTHLIASPMRRTLYTCLLSFEPVLNNSSGTKETARKVVALPEVQEISPLPCDTGSPVDKLAAEFGDRVDLSLLTPEWNDKSNGSAFAPRMGQLEARAQKARVWLRELGRQFAAAGGNVDAHIVVVTHGGFLHFLTQDWDGMNPAQGTGWLNTEWRSYEFAGDDDEEARLRETRASWRRRRGSEVGLTETEQKELRIAMKGRLEEEWGA